LQPLLRDASRLRRRRPPSIWRADGQAGRPVANGPGEQTGQGTLNSAL